MNLLSRNLEAKRENYITQPSLHITLTACRRAGIVAVSAQQLKPIKKLMLKLTTKSQKEFGQARY